jgi:hypothetical protein
VAVDATGVTDSTQFEYGLKNSTEIGDVNLTLTGQTNKQSETVSKSGLTNGDSINIDVGGNVDPTGPSSNNKPTVTLSARRGLDIAAENGRYDSTLSYIDSVGNKITTSQNAYDIGGVGDIDGDGDPETAYKKYDNLKYIGSDGNVVSTGLGINSVGGVGDIDGDGDLDVAFTSGSLQYIDHAGNVVDTGVSANNVGGIGDIDGDGTIEIAFTDNDNNLKYTDNAGNVNDTGKDAGSVGPIGDFNDDGDTELLYAQASGRNLKYIDSAGNLVDTGVDANSIGGMGDIDGDGDLDVAYSKSDGSDVKYIDAAGNTVNTGRTAYEVGGVGDLGSDKSQTSDPAIDIDGDGSNEVSITGNFSGSETREITLDTGSDSGSVSTSSGSLDLKLDYTERSQTVDPSITIASDAGSQTVDYAGTLADGSTADLSGNINESMVAGNVTLTTGVNSPSSGPQAKFDFGYNHASNKTFSTQYAATQFEERYNVSESFAEGPENAKVTIPFASSRVVAVETAEYQINGGSWQSLSASEYSFNNSRLTADISAAYGGALPNNSTVGFRSTGRKVTVASGNITVLDATAPGDDLDTELRVDSRSEGFAINVGPTESGSRVHYATSDDFGGSGPTGSAVIEANGDQHVELPNALAGDKMRMQHLKTKVTPDRGDVRVEVQEVGSNPKLDISPGPGGAGDPVSFEYYRTQSGSEYILQSITEGIVRDSDVANSPAILSDDDSDELLAISLDTIGGGSTESGSVVDGVVGPIQSNTGFELPTNTPIAIFGAIAALGGAVVLFWRPTTPTAADRSVPGLVSYRLRRAVPVVGSTLGTVASWVLMAARRAVSAVVGSVVSAARWARDNPTLAGIIGVAGVLIALATGAINVPPGTTVLILVPTFALVSFIGLRQFGYFSVLVWGVGVSVMTLLSLIVLGIDFSGLINEQTSIILAVGGLYLAYRLIQAIQAPESTTELIVQAGRRNGGDGK